MIAVLSGLGWKLRPTRTIRPDELSRVRQADDTLCPGVRIRGCVRHPPGLREQGAWLQPKTATWTVNPGRRQPVHHNKRMTETSGQKASCADLKANKLGPCERICGVLRSEAAIRLGIGVQTPSYGQTVSENAGHSSLKRIPKKVDPNPSPSKRESGGHPKVLLAQIQLKLVQHSFS